ncbi:MAG: 4-(cytidine 5'-diphospho)-2-C-methyl-D-erythritol kinase [Planctomycetaceae bacterium]|nr:4-(cytidine 5'-diphospho)-2-C-methyl-D-erythritol kinase [Planctomycetaceae bacterium]
MIIRSDGDRLTIQSPAKINLFLDVLGRREDGFHDLETVICAIDLQDTLEMRVVAGNEITLHLHGNGTGQREPLPEGEDNIIVKALRLLAQSSGVDQGMEVTLTKRIPSAAGLGGASSNAAAVLLGAARLWQRDWSLEQLAEVAAEVGSDVPFFLHGPAAICRGRGEIVQPLQNRLRLHLVLVHPPAGLSTARVFAHCQPGRPVSSAALIEALETGNRRALLDELHNSLQRTAAGLEPWVGRLEEFLSGSGCLGFQMSGSGTSFFAICAHRQHARQVAARLRSQQPGQVDYASTLDGKKWLSGWPC